MKITLDIQSCVECPFHKVEADPDRLDSFCSDDEKLICQKTGKTVTSACRPYNLKKETAVPPWCPLLPKNNKTASPKRK